MLRRSAKARVVAKDEGKEAARRAGHKIYKCGGLHLQHQGRDAAGEMPFLWGEQH